RLHSTRYSLPSEPLCRDSNPVGAPFNSIPNDCTVEVVTHRGKKRVWDWAGVPNFISARGRFDLARNPDQLRSGILTNPANSFSLHSEIDLKSRATRSSWLPARCINARESQVLAKLQSPKTVFSGTFKTSAISRVSIPPKTFISTTALARG